MSAWILIGYFYSSLQRHGGPVAVEFSSKAACETAIAELQKPPMSRWFDTAICVPKGVPANG